MKLADPLVDAILAGLVTFAVYSESEDLILASITLPQFRRRWLDEVKKRTRACLVVRICWQSGAGSREGIRVWQCLCVSQEDDFFCYDSLPTQNTDARAQVDMFLTETSTDIDCLHKFPLSNKLFLKYNTTLPSSAPVERLFSLGF